VTVNATGSFDHYTRAIGTGLWLTKTVTGKTNQVTTTTFYLLLP